MIRAMQVAFGVAVLSLTACGVIAQTAPPAWDTEGEDNPRGNVHLGMPMSIPLNDTAKAVHLGFGATLGGGYNFTRKHGIVGDFVWNDLFPTNEALAKIRTALNDPRLDASVRMTELTANYRYELRGKNLGTYFIGGAGLFYRHTSLSKEVITGNSITCEPSWEWWGFQCDSGYVIGDQTIGSWSATGPGYNGGIGFTFRVGQPPYRFYAESRYHYAPSDRINMQLVEITFGIRY